MRYLKRGALVATMFLSVSVASSLQAAPMNGGFEAGLTGWMTIGAVEAVDATLGTGPISGTASAILETGNDRNGGDEVLGTPTDAEIEAFLGISSGSLDALVAGTDAFEVTEGSAIKQTFMATAGDTISFDYQVLANDCLVCNSGGVEDFAFISLAIDGVLAVLTSTFDPTVALGSGSFYEAESDVLSFSHTLTTGGLVTLGIAILDGSDDIVSSALLVDNVSSTGLAPIPLPAAFPLFAGGLGLLGLLGWRRKRMAAAAV